MSSAKSAESDLSPEAGGTQGRLGTGALTTWDCIAQSLAIGPIFSAAFVAFLIAGTAASAAPVAEIIGAVGVLALGYVISLYARRYQGAGAIYDYLRRTNPILGIFGAGIYFLGALTLDSGGFLVLGLLVSQTLGQYLNLNIPWWLGTIIMLAIVFAINHFGIKLTTRVQLALTSLSVIPLLILAVAIIVQGGAAGNTLQAFNPGAVPASGLFGGILFAILLFVGFETSASLGEETANPQRSIPRAVIGTVALAAVFFLLMIYACDIGYGLANTSKWASDSLALDTMANRYVGKWLAVLIDIAVFLDATAVMSAFMATTARGFFAIARAGLLPRPLATVSKRHNTPLGGNLSVAIVALIILVVTALSQLHVADATAQGNVFTQFGIMSTIGSLLIELIYIVLAVVAIRFVREAPIWWRWIVLAIAIVTPVLGIYGSVVPFPPFPNSLAVYVAVACVVVAGVWAFLMPSLRPAAVQKAREPYAWEGDTESTALY
jgi:amino acid transporter